MPSIIRAVLSRLAVGQRSFTLALVAVVVVVVSAGTLVLRDVRRTDQETQQIYSESVRGLDSIGELQYETQEARRSMVYALTTTDSNLQVDYAEQSRTAETRAAQIFREQKELAALGHGKQAREQFEREWSRYLKTRDAVVALILEGSVKDAVQLDLREGVPSFDLVRDDLQNMKGAYRQQAAAQLAVVKKSSNHLLIRLAVILGFTLLFAFVSVIQVQKGRMLATVRQSEARLRDVIESISEGMFVVGQDRSVPLWNSAMEHYVNRARDRVLGKPLLEAFPELKDTVLPAVNYKTLESAQPASVDGLQLSNEAGRFFNARIFTFEGGVTVFFSDVTERRKAEQALLYEKHLLATLMDNVPCGIHFKDDKGRFTRINYPQANALGLNSPKEAIGKTEFDFFPRETAEQTEAEEQAIVTLNQPVLAKDQRVARPGHPELWLSATKMPLHNAEGKTVGTFGISYDITKSKQAEEELRTALQMKSDFVSFATHQLRTPLAGIKWLLELAAAEEGVPEEPASLISDARESAQRLINMVNALLDVARLESGKLKILPEQADLVGLTQTVLKDLKLLIEKQGHQLSVQATETAVSVMADTQLLRQVIMNLMSNAIKYTPAGGKIEIRITPENDSVQWAIKDNGIGIPESSQTRLFEKFYRADNAHKVETDGSGLGLCLVRLILERSGGRIWVESEENKGSTFYFSLPLALQTAPA